MATTMMEMPKMDYVDQNDENVQRVAVMTEPFRMELRWAQIPVPAPDEVLVKVKYVGICGSDMEAYRGTREPEFISIPGRLGHEVAGTIAAIGSQVQGIQVGTRVTCRYVWGAFAEYITCKPMNVHAVPDNLPTVCSSLTEILPCVFHACELGQIDSTKNVLIMGQGVSGQMLTQAVRLFGPRNLAVTDLDARKLEMAKKHGATHIYQLPSADARTMDVVGKDFPDGFDVVIPALLQGDGIVDAIDCARMCGKIVMYGCIGKCSKTIDFFKVHRKRLEIISTEPRRDIDNRRLLSMGVKYAAEGLINTHDIIDHIVPLTDIQRAFDLRSDGSNIHVLVDCELN